jgi:alpha-L-rhamnosidase
MGRALNRAGLGDRVLARLAPWEAMLAAGMRTFGEVKRDPRSECHAWSASPGYEFLATVAGIEPSAPGFRSVCIAPPLGALSRLDASMPHPLGPISVRIERAGEAGLVGEVTLPVGLGGSFIWNGREVDLSGGWQTVRF